MVETGIGWWIGGEDVRRDGLVLGRGMRHMKEIHTAAMRSVILG